MRTGISIRKSLRQRSSSGLPAGIYLAPGTPRSVLQRAFTLIEIMVVIALLSVIVLGLLAMFNQTQRAFRLGMAQTDILESGRMATDMIGRDMQQMTPTFLDWTSGFYGTPNLAIELHTNSWQNLPGTTARRTNVLDDVFFLTHQNKTWTAIGYYVRTNLDYGPGAGPVGSLYRFQFTYTDDEFVRQRRAWYMWAAFTQAADSTNLQYASKVLDGVVDFTVRPYDPNGWKIPFDPAWYTNPPASWGPTNSLQVYGTNSISSNIPNYYFFSNAVPAFVQVELRILEPQTYQQYKSIPYPPAQETFLQNHAGQVHVFRQRIAIRGVDPNAYAPAK